MEANTVFDTMPLSELDNVQGKPPCAHCQERSYLRILVGELHYKNQLLRFELSQSQALAGQLRLPVDEVQAHRVF
jgi:arginyl-tRNA--protein-N-Asp/Glu arginylyltransferase